MRMIGQFVFHPLWRFIITMVRVHSSSFLVILTKQVDGLIGISLAVVLSKRRLIEWTARLAYTPPMHETVAEKEANGSAVTEQIGDRTLTTETVSLLPIHKKQQSIARPPPLSISTIGGLQFAEAVCVCAKYRFPQKKDVEKWRGDGKNSRRLFRPINGSVFRRTPRCISKYFRRWTSMEWEFDGLWVLKIRFLQRKVEISKNLSSSYQLIPDWKLKITFEDLQLFFKVSWSHKRMP